MTWNYRLVRYRDGSGYGLHEVYYDEAGRPTAMTVEPVDFVCDPDEGPEGVRRSLEMALSDAAGRAIFDEPETWPVGLPDLDAWIFLPDVGACGGRVAGVFFGRRIRHL